ncbi:MAG: tRNA (guanosine(37)-N1)-methyltransferase TrmD [Pseudomonadota bacterium]|jgi:tRNA (guanine37-N1)-methyltransferase|nr:tRNA (guanosine(37)-N1)-methyltransferase TrmD [Rhodobiaceae bacterium]MBS39844.1 tRNA (guanosine(37)-N1)-methyltransferase TrmD [Rhodobiaceae bacterium]MEC9098307.1 tRNA (guanosine(37)-N1)-methyltransferase TrmD [Pseudomonadota bacterium]MED5253728.1 tRNA (guanosine(37)-N1)-methyltransferase TrmD [Pseudomonadota bacterium]
MTWKANILTLYPDIYPGYLGYSLLGKALEKKIWELNIYNLRDFGEGKHKTVDDKPFGGGAGMIIKPDILGDAIAETLIKNHDQQKLVYLSPKGKPFKQVDAEKFSQSNGVSILCGHFEGIDQRVIDIYEVEEISMGDYVLTGGEVASFAFLDAIIRLLPGVLGNEISIKDESFSDNLLEYPQYTKPQEYKNIKVPDVLLSGNHEKIAEWRREKSIEITEKNRPDLLKDKNTKK